MQTYRHKISDECSGPDTSIVVFQKMDKPAIHKCYYCHELMIPTSYYIISDNTTKELEYFILDQKITKDEYEDFEREDRKINKLIYNNILLEIKKKKIITKNKKN